MSHLRRTKAGSARSTAFTFMVAAAAVAGLLALTATPVSGAGLQRIVNLRTRTTEYMVYNTMAEIAAAATEQNMTVDNFITTVDLQPSFTQFTCADGSQVVVGCYEKRPGGEDGGGLCVGPNWIGYDENQNDFVIDGSVGKDVCKYSTCTGMTCKDPSRPNVYEARDQLSCSCMADIDVGKFAITTPLDDSQLYYNMNSKNFPENNTFMCSRYVCEGGGADTYPSAVVYDYKVSSCVCYYPANEYSCATAMLDTYHTNWPSTYPATETATERPVDTQPPNTPDPAETDEPGGTADPSGEPSITGPAGYEQLRAGRAVVEVCPNYPAALSTSVWKGFQGDFCCTVFRPNSTFVACGDDAFYDMPVGWGFCESKIKSFEFCCEVERMHGGTFVFRGTTCAKEVPATVVYDSAAAMLTQVLFSRAALAVLTVTLAAALL